MPGWPGERRFAFTICDDADHGTLDRIRPVYDLLAELGLRTTKTTWVLPPDPATGYTGDSLEDAPYREYLRSLADRGFEIAIHGVRAGDSTREEIERGLAEFADAFGGPPAVHVNHSKNRDNIHWGNAWLPWWRRLLGGDPAQAFEGDRPGSAHFWGDLCRDRIRYVRGHVFEDVNTLARDPWMPWHDPQFPWVRRWFSASYGSNGDDLAALLSPPNLDRLEREGGACIVYAHLAVGFLDENGRVREDVSAALRAVAGRPGWFAPVREILDHLDDGGPRRLGPLRRLRLYLRARRDGRLRARIAGER